MNEHERAKVYENILSQLSLLKFPSTIEKLIKFSRFRLCAHYGTLRQHIHTTGLTAHGVNAVEMQMRSKNKVPSGTFSLVPHREIIFHFV